MSVTSTSNIGATLYHCPCEPPAASTSYHRLPSLYFCEECDSIHCPECVLEEVSSYYCPNCLFEVPSASVRAEKNRCARNCFLCPCCSNTLAVVPSDPSDPSVVANPLNPQASVGEPPYFLSCLACRWDSKVVGITFDKPTGLAAQLQKLDDSAPASTEYEGIRDHLEPWLKAGLSAEHAATHSTHKTTHHSSHRPTHAIAAAARALSHSNTTISRDIPSSIASASRFNSLHNLAALHRSSSLRSGLGKADTSAIASHEDALKPYKSKQKRKEEPADLETRRTLACKSLITLEQAARVDQKWCSSANQALSMDDLHPLRIPLRSKRTKRCPTCRHIVVKPDTKAASTRFKIRLVASNYLPQIDVHRRVLPSLGSRLSAVGATGAGGSTTSASRRGRVSTAGASTSPSATETLVVIGSTQDIAEPLRPGRNFSFQLTFTNPLYEAVEVLVELLDPLEEVDEEDPTDEREGDAKKSDSTGLKTLSSRANQDSSTHWNASMPGPSFGINAYAEAWEYEEEEEDDDEGSAGGDGGSGTKKSRYGPGVLAKRANKTVVQLDLAVGREASGEVRVPLYVTYTYTAEDPLAPAGRNTIVKDKKSKDIDIEGKKQDPASTSRETARVALQNDQDATQPQLKSFSFWTSISLGRVVPRVAVPGSSTLTVEDPQARRVPSSANLR